MYGIWISDSDLGRLEMDETQQYIDRFVEQLTNEQRNLYAYILTLLPRFQDADDVLQETNRVLWTRRDDFLRDTNFWAWACRIAHFQALAHLKRQRRDSRCLSLDLIEQLAKEIPDPQQFSERLLDALVYCRDKLGETSRNLIDLRYGEMLLAPQIAERTGRSPAAVRQALFVIRKDLTRCIAETLDGKEGTL
jgi:RNA polymerase sigma-70 factor (ECF subfamily)